MSSRLTYDPSVAALPWRVDFDDGHVYRFATEAAARGFIAGTSVP